MNKIYYDMIFKRKSFHIFKETGTISNDELNTIESIYKKLQPLYPEIKTMMRIVPADETTCKRGQQYCILLYSEKKEGYLQNIGYLGEQLDLHLTNMNIGALWFGIGKVKEPQYQTLDFVIMFAIAKMPEDKFRNNMFKSKRKDLTEIWYGDAHTDIGNVARFSPSACNSQPWITEASESELKVYRYRKPGKRGIMPKDKVVYYNRIDIGIYLWFLETCLHHHQIPFNRTLHPDTSDEEKVLTAVYILTKRDNF